MAGAEQVAGRGDLEGFADVNVAIPRGTDQIAGYRAPLAFEKRSPNRFRLRAQRRGVLGLIDARVIAKASWNEDLTPFDGLRRDRSSGAFDRDAYPVDDLLVGRPSVYESFLYPLQAHANGIRPCAHPQHIRQDRIGRPEPRVQHVVLLFGERR